MGTEAHYNEGIEVGKRAIDLAKRVFVLKGGTNRGSQIERWLCAAHSQ